MCIRDSPYAVHPNPRILKYFGMPQQLAGDQRQVARRGQRFLAHAVQSVGIDELRVRAAKLGRALVHPFDERRLGSRQMLSHGDRTVIGRADRNRLCLLYTSSFSVSAALMGFAVTARTSTMPFSK